MEDGEEAESGGGRGTGCRTARQRIPGADGPVAGGLCGPERYDLH